MKLSLIWIASADEAKNNKTLECIRKESGAYKDSLQLLIYGAPQALRAGFSELPGKTKAEFIEGFEGKHECEIYEDAQPRLTGKYVTLLDSGDVWSENTLTEFASQAASHATPGIVMLEKVMPDGRIGAFSKETSTQMVLFENLKEKINAYPFYFGGSFVKTELLAGMTIRTDLPDDGERKLFLDLCADRGRILFVRSRKYYSSIEREGDNLFFRAIYHKDFYDKSFSDFWLPYFEELKERYGQIPRFIQYHAMFSITKRISANLNNRNKHVIEEGHEQECIDLMARVIQQLDDEAVFNALKVSDCVIGDSIKWVYGILKYGEDYRFDEIYLSGKPYYTSGKVAMNTINSLSTNILFMNYVEGKLEIDGSIHALAYSIADEVYFTFAGKKYKPEYNERYGLNKIFGVSIYKSHSFHLSIPMMLVDSEIIHCYARVGQDIIKLRFSYASHFSRMSGRFASSYWYFGDQLGRFLMTKEEDGLRIRKAGEADQKAQEKALQKEMFKEGIRNDRRSLLFIAIRKAFFFMKPKMKKQPIWMYLDKIYKGGDSSEYLYRYASAQDNNFKHYYLIDKKATDHARLKKDGFKPLVRGSIKHRLVFLMADMMVISNSTVYAFNNFGMINSSYIRDLPDFHVVCVQHGMSVQKIAVAQNRLRDNTRLYFCASKYELHNLQKPVYDYMGYRALKLTGVPRYDGLVDDDKKQIMISPTWRMQAAAPVRTSEGEQRDYNPLFKESTYYKVFNSLINDPRLIEAAEKYGYRIKYVLHPIVSSQVEDFDKNDYVDIVPAVGDMSYETMFRESSLMVTDFSGIQFDFAYMRKPLVYLHHKDIPQHYEEGTFFYDTMAFGEIVHDNDELIDMLTDYMAHGCKMKPEYVRRADDFFFYRDHENCARIYKEMVDYQKEFILGQKEYEKLAGTVDMKEFRKDAEKAELLLKENGMKAYPRTTNDNYFDLPIKEGTVLLAGLGKNVRGNLQYILNELNENPDFTGYRCYVRTDDEMAPVVQNYIDKNHWTRTQVVTSNSEYSRLMETCQYLITEIFFPESWVKKPGQTYINIWHGTPLKKLGLAKNSKNVHKDGNTQRNFIDTDYLIYPNEYTRKNMLESYKVADLLTGSTGLIGYARTGGMLQELANNADALKAKLAPHGEKLYAYMPTWKDYLKESQVVDETRELLDYLDSVLRDDQILYSNLHHKVSDVIDYDAYKHIRKFPSDVDSYALLAATEALITDYSSVFYDYLATRKQIILYCADYELYAKKRGTYMDLMSLPFDKAGSKEEVAEAINRGKTYDDSAAYEEFCSHDSTANARLLTGLLEGEFADEPVKTSPRVDNGKKKILLDSECFEEGPESSALQEFAGAYDKDKNQIWLTCEMFSVDKNKKVAYPMMHDNPVIGTTENIHMSGRARAIKELYEAGRIGFEQAFAILKYDYALQSQRMFGHAKFDAVLMADEINPERILSLALMDAEHYFVITDKIAAAVAEGDRLMTDAVRYAAGRSSKVWAESEDAEKILADKLPEVKTEAFEGAKSFAKIQA